ncbi:MAG: twin-arginine translocation signal domain-containing protein [Gemmatimonadetes bacterium]|nr:twin-arginine translocation signal domain-containing protein [Gemmatimonadota bacterium]
MERVERRSFLKAVLGAIAVAAGVARKTMPQLFPPDKPMLWSFQIQLSPFIPKGYVYSISNTIWANRESWEKLVNDADTRTAYTDGLAQIARGLSPRRLDRRGEQRENLAARGRRTWDPSEGGCPYRCALEERLADDSLEDMLTGDWERIFHSRRNSGPALSSEGP